MGCYISEEESREALEDIVKTFTDNYRIYVRKRVTSSPARKKVTYAIVFVYSLENEDIYNAILNYNIIQNKETKILQSETFLDNAKKKEVFFVECEIEIG